MLSSEQKKELFHTELVKHGVTSQKAAKVAEILVFGELNKPFTYEEQRLTEEVFSQGLREYKRLNSVPKKRRRSKISLA